MVGTTPHSILEWKPESEPAWKYYQTVPSCARILSRPGVRPYRANLFPIPPSPQGPDPFLNGILSREGGLSRYLSCLAEPGVLTALDSDVAHVPAAGGVGAVGAVSAAPRPDAAKPQLPLPGRPVLSASPTPDLPSVPSAPAENPFPMHLDFYTLGPSLHGVPNNIHGGVLTALIDALCGKTGFLHRDPACQVYSAYTNVHFRRPVVTDADGSIVVLVKTQISHRQTKGKKMVALASVESPDGKVYATGESMVIETVWKGRI